MIYLFIFLILFFFKSVYAFMFINCLSFIDFFVDVPPWTRRKVSFDISTYHKFRSDFIRVHFVRPYVKLNRCFPGKCI